MSPGPVATDVLAAGHGDREAFTRLVDEYRNVVCSVTLAIVRDVHASEDLAQDVFVAAWTGLGRLRSPDSFLPWLRQLARNRAHEFVRSRVRARRGHAGWRELVQLQPASSASEHMIAAEEGHALAQALDQLPADAREVVTLYYREGNSTRQVASLLGHSEEAVKKRLERARTALRGSVLARFADSAKRTAPGAAFTAAVAAALAAGAPATASAGVLGVTGAGALGKAAGILAGLGGALAGLGGGLFGIWFGLRLQKRNALDQKERRQLTRLGLSASALAVVATTGMLAARPVAARGHPRLAAFLTMAAFLVFGAGLAWLYVHDLPRIISRRLGAERARDSTAEPRQRREARFGLAGLVLGLLCGTAGALLGCWFLLRG
jgi:RNA polymerase sigma factor (sigma-70 family)